MNWKCIFGHDWIYGDIQSIEFQSGAVNSLPILRKCSRCNKLFQAINYIRKLTIGITMLSM